MRPNRVSSRRDLLRGAALTAVALTMASCTSTPASQEEPRRKPSADPRRKGSETRPLPTPGTFRESPRLAKLVASGELPPVEERVPDHPYVVPHRWLDIGTYGGTLRMPSSADQTWATREYFYGHSLLRWVNDGQDIVGGLVEKWSSNDDATVWTFEFRRGLRWSDGHPWTTADIMFWWEDMVLDEEHSEGIPDEARSGTGKVATLEAPDEYTLVMTFDVPNPLLPEMIANWVNRGIDATWMEPKHYLKDYHPKYGKRLPSDWTTKFDDLRNYTANPESPTMNAWKLETFQEGRSSTWQRNPYYYAVDREGNQLPYIDELHFDVVANEQTRKLKIHNGEYDFVHGAFAGITLTDVATLQDAAEKTGHRVIFWDSGSGTGSMFFFNQDYHEPKLRALIRDPRFRQALSYAFDREEVRKTVYFSAGELTTGGYGPKTMEFHRGKGPSMYEQWRDSYVSFDPKRAERMLDDLGVVDRDGDGKREMPDGSKLVITLDYPADHTGEHVSKNQLLKKSWDAIGIDTRLNPVPSASLDSQWEQGKLMSKTAWEVSTITLASSMLWLMPMETSRWAPLQGRFYSLRGTPDEKKQLDRDPYDRTPPRMEPEPGGPVDRLWRLADRVVVETDQLKRDALVWEMVKIHLEEGPFFIGSVANYPQVEIVRNGLRNVPAKEQTALGGFVNDWEYPMPAAYDPESWFWDSGDS